LASKRLGINQILVLKAIIFTFILAFSLYQVSTWHLFPWLNLSIVFGSSLLCLLFALIVNIQIKYIKISILVIAFFQLLISSFLLSQPEILRSNWQWLFFSLVIVFCMILLDLFSRKIPRVFFWGRIFCLTLFVLTFIKFLYSYKCLNYLIMAIVLISILFLLFSKNNSIKFRD
jgi:hypothetical protein